MNKLLDLSMLHAAFGRLLDRLQPLFLLGTRFYVGWQFWKSGWLKVTAWDQTLGLFRDEYRVPVLPPELAAYVGASGELFFPALLFLGLFGRLGALGALAVNIMAVVSYAYVLLADGSEAALAQHVLWGFMLILIAVFGSGSISLDAWLVRRAAARCRPDTLAAHAVAG